MSSIPARAGAYASCTAIVDRGRAGVRSCTYQDLDQASGRVAATLLEGREDLLEQRVAFQISPGIDHATVQWGIWRAGGIAVPLPAAHPPAELDYLIHDSEASIVVADAVSAPVVSSIANRAGARFHTAEELVASRLPLASSPAPLPPLPQVEAGRRAMIIYTSGTTGRPKGVVTTHESIDAQIESLVSAWEWTASDRTLLVLPLHHVHGIINVLCCALWSGAVCETLPRFDSEATWERLASGELTVFTAVPTIYHRLIQSWDAAPPEVRRARSDGCRAMRLMMSGSAALPRHTLDRWREITDHVLLERYGMTEVGMALANPLHGERRPGFVGQPLPGVSARLDDGELQLKGRGVFSEYWKRPEHTRESFVDGWFKTGDVAVIEDGAYRLLGRSSVDIIKSGGDKCSALEIEEVLRSHPAIVECAVVGLEDHEWGQRVCAAVELSPGSDLGLADLREWAKPRLAPYKIPKQLICVPSLPRNAMGKILKPEVATLFARPAPPAHPAS